MSDEPTSKPRKPAPSERGDRLKAALKANLARRKAQAQARDADRDETGHDTRNED
ncbi:hypothetical protein ABIE58_001837 [Roseovarius sp. MBR-78]|jgi:hypothetical protein|uniref:hypothetical protein n=1 Tax=Roseovarius sp. MBR-78 TaxID=3156460 RepID=UPI0033997FB1